MRIKKLIFKIVQIIFLCVLILLFGDCYASNTVPKGGSVYLKTLRANFDKADQYVNFIFMLCQKHGTNPWFLLSLIEVESSWREQIISYKNAIGLTQICLETAKQYDKYTTKEKLMDPYYNLEIACEHLKFLLYHVRRNFPDSSEFDLVAAAWNAGLGAVNRAHGIPNNGETPTMVYRLNYFYKLYYIEYKFGISR